MEQDNSKKRWETMLEEAEKKLSERNVQGALQSLSKAAPLLSQELEDRRRLRSDVKVVHYTSLETMHTLLDPTQYLRLYDSVHLTDPQEGWYVFKEWVQKLGGRQQPVADPASVRGFLESTVSHAYIISFFPYKMKDGEKTYDDLSHWRAYGDNGRGCSIVVSVPKMELYTVNYCPIEREKVACKLQQFVNVSYQVWKEAKTDKKRKYSLSICATALKSRFLHKHPSYEHECEQRALVADPEKSEITTEVQGRHIRHYVTKPAFKMDCLLTSECRITVGPAVDHKYDVAESFERILGNRGPKVDVSEIPYRTI